LVDGNTRKSKTEIPAQKSRRKAETEMAGIP
jgi:hypothetical protein